MGFIEKLRERIRRARLEREATYAVLAVEVGVESGLSPLKSFELLADMDSIPNVGGEVLRIKRDALLNLRHLSEQIAVESKEAGGTWGRLLSTIAYVEKSGLDPVVALRDLLKTVLRDLRTDYERLSQRFRTLVSSSNVMFGAFPMMVAVILTILSSGSVLPAMVMFMTFNCLAALLWIVSVDAQVPEIADYRPFYRRITLKYLPISLVAGISVYLGLVYTPAVLIFHKVLTLTSAALIFTLPSYFEWRIQDSATRQLLEDLPRILRDVAEQVDKGYGVHRALENAYSTGGYQKYTMKLLSLLIKEARIKGSLREAYDRVKSLLPKPWRISLELLVLIEETGAGAGATHALADSMHEYMLMIREFRRSTSAYKYLSLGMTALTVALILFIMNTVMVKLVLVGALLAENPGIVTLPFSPPTPEELPIIKDYIFLLIALNSLILSIVTGKTCGWRLGDSIAQLLKTSILLLIALSLSSFIA